MCLAILEFLGTTELMVVLLVALIIFGPRKLPQLGRSLGQAISQFRRASDDFKRTWESEAMGSNEPRPAEQPAEAPSALPAEATSALPEQSV